MMKNTVLYIVFFYSVFQSFSVTSSEIINSIDNTTKINIDTSRSISKEFKVIKIKKIKNGFILNLHDEKNDKWFSVVSVKYKGEIKNCSKLKTGRNYFFTIQKFYKNDIIPNIGLKFRVTINGIEMIVPSESWTGNVYFSSDLKGLYLCPLNTIPKKPKK
jgi:hypothetical protein